MYLNNVTTKTSNLFLFYFSLDNTSPRSSSSAAVSLRKNLKQHVRSTEILPTKHGQEGKKIKAGQGTDDGSSTARRHGPRMGSTWRQKQHQLSRLYPPCSSRRHHMTERESEMCRRRPASLASSSSALIARLATWKKIIWNCVTGLVAY